MTSGMFTGVLLLCCIGVSIVYGDDPYVPDVARLLKYINHAQKCLSDTKAAKSEFICKWIYQKGLDLKKIPRSDLQKYREILVYELNPLNRHKRQEKSATKCGPRVRKEVRRMSTKEWKDYTEAVQNLKKTGAYDFFAGIHRDIPGTNVSRMGKAHGGPNFLGWHRVYLLFYESALRVVKPCVTLPYWDTSLDFEMSDPVDSIVWTDKYFGNGDGIVVTGPFKNWKIKPTNETLTRNIGAYGSLISKAMMNRIFTRTSHSQIFNFTDWYHYLEGYHNGGHVWVDGHMSFVEFAAEDPLFFMFHCFIDYWWYLFELKLYYLHGINPYDDYPPVSGYHNAGNAMDPFFFITNRFGYHFFWLTLFGYELSPRCSYSNTNCGSPDLYCNTTLSPPKCVSKTAPSIGKRQAPVEKTDKSSIIMSASLGERFKTEIIDRRARRDQLAQAKGIAFSKRILTAEEKEDVQTAQLEERKSIETFESDTRIPKKADLTLVSNITVSDETVKFIKSLPSLEKDSS